MSYIYRGLSHSTCLQPLSAAPMEDDVKPPPSFEGRLDLSAFKHQEPSSSSSSSPRRSTRLSSTASPAPPTTLPNTRRPSHRNTSTPPSASTSTSPSSIPPSKIIKKRSKKPSSSSSSYAPPSTYSHLPLLPDRIAPNLLVLFIGLNPGIRTARSGHAYAHPSNLFWKLLHSSGITPQRCYPEEDASMPERYSLGLTNIVSRPSRNGGELKNAELDDGVAVLEAKAREWRPEVVCVVGKSIWEAIWRVRHGGKRVGKGFRYGWQDEEERMGVTVAVESGDDGGGGGDGGGWEGSKVFVATSTSGLAASMRPEEKQAVWRELGEYVEKRRAERALHTRPPID